MTVQSGEAIRPASAVPTVLVVLGIDAEKKPHASKFGIVDREIVLRAAGLMAYRVIALTDDDVGKLKAAIPDGKVFATGKGFVPFIRRELYDQLAEKLGTAAEVAVTPPPTATAKQAAIEVTSPKPSAKPVTAKRADVAPVSALSPPWLALAVGTTVLARDDENESWFEAIIVSIADDDTNVLRMRWRDYPEEGQFTRHRGRVGLIGPGGK